MPTTVDIPELPDTWTLHGDHYHTDGEWSQADDQMLDSLLGLADHQLDHDPVACQLDVTPPGWQGPPNPRIEWSAIREAENMGVRDVAEIAGVDSGTVSRWETGHRRPDNQAYFTWLREADQRQSATVVFDVWRQIARRDGWTRDHGRARLRDHWRNVWRPGGTFDVWRDTGELPMWTPEDAGLTGG